jgi:hypothetical protein
MLWRAVGWSFMDYYRRGCDRDIVRDYVVAEDFREGSYLVKLLGQRIEHLKRVWCEVRKFRLQEHSCGGV